MLPHHFLVDLSLNAAQLHFLDYLTHAVQVSLVGAEENRNGAVIEIKAVSGSLKLDFLDADTTYCAIVYEDGPDADYEKNPYPMTIRQEEVTNDSTLKLRLARSGGAAVRIEKLRK